MNFLQRTDTGLVQYHEQVIADIAKAAVEEIDGVKLIPQGFSDLMLEMIGVKRTSGVGIDIDKSSNSVSLEIRIRLRYGLNIPETAQKVQDKVRDQFEHLTDIDLRNVHINVQGIEKGSS